MCTMIATKTRVTGAAKAAHGWITVDEASIGFDHATHAWSDHALRIDFMSSTAPGVARVAVEMDFASGKLLLARLEEVIAAAERSGMTD